MSYRPNPPTPRQIQTLRISPGERGIDETVGMMTDLIRAGSMWPYLRPLALKIVTGCPERDFECMAEKVFQFVQMNMKFVNDNYGVETLQTVPHMIEAMHGGVAHGDCDDFTILLGALLKSLGFQTKIRVLKFIGGNNFSHVMLVANLRGGGWREFDGSVRSGETSGAIRREQKDYPIIQ
jgi:transglutaminase-like putative cysteine protease